ncbi:MAG TPA: phosphoenolpyruvate--protein phosphotransferase [Balneolales bacterium]|nr:phosphoenolpyruvate--protein phosphotransferase [Balneolales bacterium]
MNEVKERQKGEMVIEGLSAAPGIAIGPAFIYQRGNIEVDPQKVDSNEIERELQSFEEVRALTIRDLKRISSIGRRGAGNDTSDIIDAQIEIVNDPELQKSVQTQIKEQQFKADFAVCEAFKRYLGLIESSGNKLMIERLVDVRDIRDRMVRKLQHRWQQTNVNERSIIVSDEITPSEIIEFTRNNILAVALNKGGVTAHTSIIANAMSLPLVIGSSIATKVIKNGEKIIVDGTRGRVIIRPCDETLEKYQRLLRQQKRKERNLQKILHLPATTASGEHFSLQANIEFDEELVNIEKFKADGIGLLRTESLFIADGMHLDRSSQEAFYRKSLIVTGNQQVTIRLFDVGGDKILNETRPEANPFLGWRGIRVLLDRKDLLNDQLYAILKVAGEYPGRIKILLPMISTLEELLEVKNEIAKVQQTLRDEGHIIDKNIKVGIMIEVPSTAIQADGFAPYVDFFSVGTNDLTQYVLAVDRGNTLISNLYQQMHPAVWRLIKMTAEAAAKYNKEIAVCGELASKPFGAMCLMGMGISQFSMVPTAIPKVKKILVTHTLDEMKKLTEEVEHAVSYSDMMKIINNWYKENDQNHG